MRVSILLPLVAWLTVLGASVRADFIDALAAFDAGDYAMRQLQAPFTDEAKRTNAGFAPEGQGLVYRGRLVLLFGAFTGLAERIYRYSFPVPGRAEVSFEDGRPFHTLDLSHGRWSVAHCCCDDLYRGSFEIEGRDYWTMVWRVSGPFKDHMLSGRRGWRRRAVD